MADVIRLPRRATDVRDRATTEQDVGTPLALIEAVQKRLGKIELDLASTEELAVVSSFISPAQESLSMPWHQIGHLKHRPNGWGWLNPPFGQSAKWVAKCAEEAARGARLIVLLQAAVDSNYFAEHIYGRAEVWFLQGRLTFRGHTQPYPKGCMLCIYAPGRFPHLRVWDWKRDVLR